MAARPLHLTHNSLFLKLLPKLPLLSSLNPRSSSSSSYYYSAALPQPQPSPRRVPFSTTSTPYPLQYDLIVNTPVLPKRPPDRRRGNPPAPSAATHDGPDTSGSDENSAVEMEFDDWVEKKLSLDRPGSRDGGLDRAKRKYLKKRERRLYGSDSEDERKGEGGFVELKPKVVEFDRLHEREEELYFYDAFAYPWDKDKHYKMVYKLEKKYFPNHCLDKAFIDEREYNEAMKGTKNAMRRKKGNQGGVDDSDRKFVFFDEDVVKEKEEKKNEGKEKDLVVEKKVEEFFKCLKKVPSEGEVGGDGEPYLVTRSTDLPPRWDGPNGTVVLINKPKGWTSFTVCGKLRRLVKVKKVGHAGTLDPMATGLLIVCVGKATKLADEYQGMVKGYSGVFRLGEATSTLDADSPV